MYPLLSLTLLRDEDVVAARRCAAHLAALLQFDPADQTRIATAVSEIVRNALRYAENGAICSAPFAACSGRCCSTSPSPSFSTMPAICRSRPWRRRG